MRRIRKTWLGVGIFAALLIGGFPFAQDALAPNAERVRSERVHLVDYRMDEDGKVWLFRGADPVVGKHTFAYEALVAAMRAAAAKKNVTLPQDFHLVDVSFLFIERADLAAEKEFFAANPDKGEFLQYPIFGVVGPAWLHRVLNLAGALVSPSEAQAALENAQRAAAPVWSRLDIAAVQALHRLMEEAHDRPVVIYAHCFAGCDRTGEVIGAYRMQHMDMGLRDVYALSTQECGRPIRKPNRRALQAYCTYLGRTDCAALGNSTS